MLKPFTFLSFLLLAGSCQVSQPSVSYNLDTEKEPLNITTALNNEVTFVMQTNPSTGYSWQTNLQNVAKQVAVVTDTIIAPNNSKGMAGVPAQKKYVLKFTQTGQVTLQFNYLRVWETNVPPVKEKTVVVTVQ